MGVRCRVMKDCWRRSSAERTEFTSIACSISVIAVWLKAASAIIEAKDDVGQMLFAAGTGLADLRERLNQLEDGGRSAVGTTKVCTALLPGSGSMGGSGVKADASTR